MSSICRCGASDNSECALGVHCPQISPFLLLVYHGLVLKPVWEGSVGELSVTSYNIYFHLLFSSFPPALF